MDNGNQPTFNFKRYNLDQKKAIEIYKWEASERAGKDLGAPCIKEWVSRYAKLFRTIATSTGEYVLDEPNMDMVSYWVDMFHEIEIHKWIRCEKAGRDLGSACVDEWVEQYAHSFKQKAYLSGKYNL